MTRRNKLPSGVLIEEHPFRPGYPDIEGHKTFKRMKMGVVVRGQEMIESLKRRLERSRRELGLTSEHESSGKERMR